MRRREFITLLGGAAAWPNLTHAQQANRIQKVAVFTGRTDDAELSARVGALSGALSKAGWTEGRNIRFELHSVAAMDQWSSRAADLVAAAPDVIVAIGNPAVAALREKTSSVPIVFTQVGDPVGSGFVTSLAKPGGNITGFMHYEPAMGSKWLEAVKEIAPSLGRVLVLFLPDVSANVEFVRAAEAAGPLLNVEVSSAGVRNSADIEREINAFARKPDGGLIVLPNPLNGDNRALIAGLAFRHRLPAIAAFRYMATSGLLASYGIEILELYRRAAPYVDRILKGEKAADLPVQAPTKYELVINLKTAKALGLEVPPMLLARADEVIE